MDDLISRVALLDEFRSLCGPQTGDGWDNMGVRNLIMRQKTVDAVPVNRGRWVADSDGLPVCSVCDAVAMQRLHCDTSHRPWLYDVRLVKTPYCSNCGAKMIGDDNG